jgi:hypothetical protein
VTTVNSDGSITTSTEDEDGGPTGLVTLPGPVTTTFDGPAEAESKVVGASESKTVSKAPRKSSK